MKNALIKKWHELKDIKNSEKGIRTLRIDPHKFYVYAGWIVSTDKPSLILEVDTKAIPNDIEFPQSRGFSVKTTPSVKGRNGKVRFIIESEKDEYSDIFSVLSEDICRSISEADSETSLIKKTIRQLNRWQLFLKQHNKALLSKNQQIGLWGELAFLNSSLLELLRNAKAVESWQGPDSGNQDFEFNKIAVEIKTSTSNPHEKIHISNVRQLEPAGLDKLYINHLAIVRHLDSGKTLPDLIQEIRTQLSDNPDILEMFNEKLFNTGYLDSYSDLYSKTGYEILSENVYHVGEGFPRILSENVPDGVGDIKYSIALSACSEYRMKENPFLPETATNE